MDIRIGQGFDVHAFDDGQQNKDKIVVGGVMVPYDKGIIAHSDGDVLLHALSDALLGACGLGDIGKHFPDTDPAYKNANSRDLLRMVYSKVRSRSYHIINADMTIIAQAPKMLPYIEGMRTNIASDLQTHKEFINVKATTTERLGMVGREEGIAAQAVVLLQFDDFGD